jgi:MinD superfamily P-loop ATPase
LSGKGGTGKTILATSLALAWKEVGFVDCDVEGPDAHLLLQPQLTSWNEVTVPVPRIREDACTHCGECADFCRFHALAVLPDRCLVFDELCHACGGCRIVCPARAIDEVPRVVGRVAEGRAGDLPFVQGILNEGEARALPVIHAALRRAPAESDVILDGPPGASCPMLAVAEAADVVLLVAEPTPFGLHDLEAAAAAVRERGRPMAVAINRSDWGDGAVQRFCGEAGLPVVLEVPHLREVAEAYARGVTLIASAPALRTPLRELHATLAGLVREAAA